MNGEGLMTSGKLVNKLSSTLVRLHPSHEQLLYIVGKGRGLAGRPASQRLGAAARGHRGVDPHAGSSARARSAWAGRRRQLASTDGMAAASAGRARPGRGFGWRLRGAVLLA